MSLDLLVVNPGAAHGIYGELGNSLIAVEPPLWCRILAAHARDKGYDVDILDAEACGLSGAEAAAEAHARKPRLVCVAVYGHQPSASTQQMWGARQFCMEFVPLSSTPVVMVGGHPSALPRLTLEEEVVDYVAMGEGPATVEGLLAGHDERDIPGLVWSSANGDVNINKAAPLFHPDDLHGNAWDLLPMDRYRAHNWQRFDDLSKRQPYASVFTSLGCPYKCLAGDTPVNTIHGAIPIRELAERYGDAGIPVYTYDPERREVFISDSVRVRKYGENEQLVRVHFDDGTHIDCTPDHRFLQFKWGNGRSPSREWECEAAELTKGAHVRAMRLEVNKSLALSRAWVTWGRRLRKLRSRMVMEYEIGRPLRREEHVHHRDHDTLNDALRNLELCESAEEHFKRHPEFAERMRLDNPTKNGMSSEWRENLSAANRGKVRSQSSRLRYRESKLGEKNPNYRHGKRSGTGSRIAEVNHRVVSVEWLNERSDVYCLTVPATGWFFANNVVVRNCSFCCINAPFDSNKYRMRSPTEVVEEIRQLNEGYGVETFKITDEMFVLNEKHYTAICEGLIESGLGKKINVWAYARVDTVKPDTLTLLRRAGIQWLALGIESGSAHVRDGALKKLRQNDIVGTVRTIQDAGINVIGNFMFGLRDDDEKTMKATLDLAIQCRPDFANFYSTMAYPGSGLYAQAVKEGWTLPETWRGYSQHNDDCRPLDTEHVSGKTVLAYRDEAFRKFFTDRGYLDHIFDKFGAEAEDHVHKMLSYRLKRKLLEAA